MKVNFNTGNENEHADFISNSANLIKHIWYNKKVLVQDR